MGLKDAATKNFFGRNDMMAGILNYLFHNGRHVIKQSQLREMNNAFYKIVQLPDGSFKTDNTFRDKLFEYSNGKAIMSVGLELQSRNDKTMVQRIMVYDARRYIQLQSEGRMHPIINIVLDFDRKRRHPPDDLLQMLKGDIEICGGKFRNYGYISLNIYEMAEKYDKFPCRELRDVLYLFKLEKEGRPFKDALAAGRLRRSLSRDAALVCAIFLGMDIRIDDDKEKFNMCRMIREVKREGFKEGEAKGKAEGKAEGEANAIRRVVTNMLRESRDILEICRFTGASQKLVKEIQLSLQ